MKIATQFGKLAKDYGIEGSIRILAKAGFEADQHWYDIAQALYT